jgi:hypothetical protein
MGNQLGPKGIAGLARLVACAIAVAAGLAWSVPQSAFASAGTKLPLSKPHVFGWDINQPCGVSADRTHAWVANYRDDSLTELSASTGKGKTIGGPQIRIQQPLLCFRRPHPRVGGQR